MPEESLPTYPHLIDMQPIKGTFFKASQVVRPHPKITPMTEEQVLKHRKREGLATLNRIELDKKPKQLTTVAGRKEPNVFYRLGLKLKKIFGARHPKQAQEVLSIQAYSMHSPVARTAQEDAALAAPSATTMALGSHCGQSSYTTGRIQITPINPAHVRTLQVVTATPIQDSNSYPSGSTLASDWLPNDAPGPIINSNASSPIDLDVFPDFDGAYEHSSSPARSLSSQTLHSYGDENKGTDTHQSQHPPPLTFTETLHGARDSDLPSSPPSMLPDTSSDPDDTESETLDSVSTLYHATMFDRYIRPETPPPPPSARRPISLVIEHYEGVLQEILEESWPSELRLVSANVPSDVEASGNAARNRRNRKKVGV